MPLVSDPQKIDRKIGPDGQQADYLILSDDERAKGFIRQVRRKYVHVGIAGPKYPVRDLTEEEADRHALFGYAKFEPYPDGMRGRFWKPSDLKKVGKGCGAVTTMAQEIAETYARDPNFYSGTFCVRCGVHLPVGEAGEFVWEDGTRVGT